MGSLMTSSSHDERKASREVEIDHLLAEEFACDPGFAERFADACGLRFKAFRVLSVVPEPPLGGDGYGDLLVEAEMDGRRIALLVEDKITASPATRQAERYKAYAERLRDEGFESVRTVLVAPETYVGQRDQYDNSVNLEQVVEMLSSPDPRRLEFRRRIIRRALEKKETTGVKNPDLALHKLHSKYLKWVSDRCAAEEHPYEFPPLKEAYGHTESWVDNIRHPDFPLGVRVRHRLWTSVKDAVGRVDLTISTVPETEREHLEVASSKAFPDEVFVEPFGSSEGVQVSLRVPEMRQSTGFREADAEDAFSAIERLTQWYLSCVKKRNGSPTSLR